MTDAELVKRIRQGDGDAFEALMNRYKDPVYGYILSLVRSEDAAGDIWHADLYRLGHTDEVIELGLEAAFDTALCLVEWPDRLGPLAPANALHLSLAPEGEGRRLSATPADHPLLRGLGQ